MIIGIPRSMFYYRYQTLIKTFFNELDINYIVSDPSSIKTLEEGKLLAPDEACTSLKMFLGHLKNLEGKCNYFFIPHFECIKKEEKVCTNFYLLYDLANNLFDTPIIDINIDEDKNKSEKSAFIDLGLLLGFSYNKTLSAYKRSKEKEKKVRNNKILKQTTILTNNKKKILIAGHPYLIYDEYLSKTILDTFKNNNIDLVFSDIYEEKTLEEDIKEIGIDTYFTFNREIIGAINKYKENVNGIILLSAFPCGPDSLTNELIIRKVKNIPLITIILDEASSETGLLTRLESFIDIVNKEVSYD